MSMVGQESAHAEVNHLMRQATTWSSFAFQAQFSMRSSSSSSETKWSSSNPMRPSFCQPFSSSHLLRPAHRVYHPTSRQMSTSTNAQPCHGRIGYKASGHSAVTLEKPLEWVMETVLRNPISWS